MDVAPEAWHFVAEAWHFATAFKNMQLWRKEPHKHSQEEWAINFITYYLKNICWCELLENNTKKKNHLFLKMHTFFCEQQKPSPQSVANVFDQRRSSKKWRRKYQFSSSLFPVLLLFLKLAKLSKEKKWKTTRMAWNLLETWKEVALQSSTSLEEFLFNGADSGERNAMQQKTRGEGKCGYR